MRLPLFITDRFQHFFSHCINESVFFISVLLCFPAFLFQKSLLILAAEVLLFCILSLLRRGRIRLLPSFCIFLSVTFFALFSPYGKVLYTVGSFSITQGALETGLRRSFILIGMVFLSQFAVASRISLPGKTGSFITVMFYYFDRIRSVQVPFEKGHILKNIDDRLYAAFYDEGAETVQAEHSNMPARFTCLGAVFTIGLPVLLYTLLIYSIKR